MLVDLLVGLHAVLNCLSLDWLLHIGGSTCTGVCVSGSEACSVSMKWASWNPSELNQHVAGWLHNFVSVQDPNDIFNAVDPNWPSSNFSTGLIRMFMFPLVLTFWSMWLLALLGCFVGEFQSVSMGLMIFFSKQCLEQLGMYFLLHVVNWF
jgi:hypothetical protein